jgi:hypothetical protein
MPDFRDRIVLAYPVITASSGGRMSVSAGVLAAMEVEFFKSSIISANTISYSRARAKENIMISMAYLE